MSWLRHLHFSGVAGKFTQRLASIVLIGFAMTLFFGGLAARQLELTDGGDTERANLLLTGGIVLAVLAIVAAGLLRTRWGITLGWVLVGLSALSMVLLPAMGIVAVIFGALWILALGQGGSMETLTRDWIAEHGNVHPDDRAHGVAENRPTERTVSRDSDPTERTNSEDSP
ncbi:DUF4233 domain-containing protein [Ornithinimicrobium faecis]|uniref:DUF4233 domain-containing protein n=1 Tax=Ornithinimicrobium faecis TaxID=2934158 RepID=UPI00211982AC|nr:DUF4233 domain-containing protein [Ornithinimicrobium sp. HY1745]